MHIIPATRAHHDAIWNIFHEVVAAGDTYTFDPDISRDKALAYWFAEGVYTFVAVDESQILGTYLLKPNHPGLGSHVANASYMVSSRSRGRGIGSAMCEHSLQEAS
jgi:L-amino acid N-acyltransferase YncA